MHAYIENNEIIRIGNLPEVWTLKNGRTVSGFHLMSPNTILGEGWFPVEDATPAYNTEIEAPANTTYSIEDKVIMTHSIEYSTESLEYLMKIIRRLTAQAMDAVTYGFTASNGHKYRLELEDQLNLQGQKDEVNTNESLTVVYWLTMDSGYVGHTVTEWLLVYKEAFQHKKDHLFRLDSARKLALNATTIAELEAVVY
jgi:hypothetical protein